MAKLTPEMISFFNEEREPKMIFIGTCDKSGNPNVCVKGTFVKLLDDENLVYADIYSVKTLKNVQDNPRAAVAAINAKTYKGYQFKGTAEVIKAGPLFDEAKNLYSPNLLAVTKLKIEEIFLMDYGPDAGKKIA